MLFFQYIHDCTQKAIANYNATLNWGRGGLTVQKMMGIWGESVPTHLKVIVVHSLHCVFVSPFVPCVQETFGDSETTINFLAFFGKRCKDARK
jgi:hypothetical protein